MRAYVQQLLEEAAANLCARIRSLITPGPNIPLPLSLQHGGKLPDIRWSSDCLGMQRLRSKHLVGVERRVHGLCRSVLCRAPLGRTTPGMRMSSCSSSGRRSLSRAAALRVRETCQRAE